MTKRLFSCYDWPHNMIRPATIHDVLRIQEIINSHAELGKMLFKSLAQIYESLRDFAVYEIEGEMIDGERTGQQRVIGCVALSIIWADLAEIRSLAVEEEYRGRGVGRRLVEWAIDESRRLQIRKLMALTYEQGFFEKLGFEVVNKESLPLKTWSDCVRCPKRDGCDEIAVVHIVKDVPMIVMHEAPPTPRGVSIPVFEGPIED
jgi:amino-acid N-acetyltransferase